jgi:hypothetical protein
MERIGDWSQAELRRFVVNTILTDPGAFPKEQTQQRVPSSATDGDVPVWDVASSRWVTSSDHPMPGHNLQWSRGASPPTSAASGDLWIYPGSNFYWKFVYDPDETTYKWKCVGGGSTDAAITTDQTFTESASFQDATGAGPTITVPRAGDYEVEAQAQIYISGQTAAGVVESSLLASSGTWDVSNAGGNSASGQEYCAAGAAVSLHLSDVCRGMSASATMKLQYRAGTGLGGTAHVRWRVIKVKPIRVN